MSSLQKTEYPVALYMNLFDQKAGSELWRLFLTAREITGSRNAQSVKVRRLGALTAAAYGGSGTIVANDYQRPNDITITVNFDETAFVGVGVDQIEHEMTAIGFEGSKNALIQDAGDAIRDFIVTEMLVTAEAGATVVSEAAATTIKSAVLISAQSSMDGNKVPKTQRVAVLDSTRKWDLWDGDSKIGLDNDELASMNKEGTLPRLFGMDIFETTLMPAATNGLFFHKSAVIAKVVDELPIVKVIDDITGIGELVQNYLRYGKAVADGDRIFKHKTS